MFETYRETIAVILLFSTVFVFPYGRRFFSRTSKVVLTLSFAGTVFALSAVAPVLEREESSRSRVSPAILGESDAAVPDGDSLSLGDVLGAVESYFRQDGGIIDSRFIASRGIRNDALGTGAIDGRIIRDRSVGSEDLKRLVMVTRLTSGRIVTGDADISGDLDVDDTLSASRVGIDGRLSVGEDVLFVDAATGGVGIGTTDPNERLTLDGAFRLVRIAVPSETADRLYNQGGVLYWSGSPVGGSTVGTWETDGTDVFRTSGNVGIGTDTPLAQLHINGTLGALSGGLAFGDGDTGFYEASDDNLRFQTLGSDQVTITSAGNVGIGTTSPSEKLDVVGSLLVGDNFFWYSWAPPGSRTDGALKTGEILIPHGDNSEEPLLAFRGVAATDGTSSVSYGGGTLYYNAFSKLLFFTAANDTTTTGTERMRIDNTGNVGIGTASSLGRLHSYVGSSAVTATSYDGYFENLATNTTTDGINKYGLYITSTGSFTGSSGTATNNYGLYVNTPTGADNNYAAIFAGGNVGIGTASPLTKLHINGTLGALSGGLAFGDGDTGFYEASDDNLRFQTLGSDQLTITSAGNVGIGTTSPIAKLTISTADATSYSTASSLYATGSDLLQLNNTDNTADGYVGILFNHRSSNVSVARIALQGGFYSPGKSAVTFGLRGPTGTTIYERMRINDHGNVGIGTADPGDVVPNGWYKTASSRLLSLSSGGTSYDTGLFLRRSDNGAGLDLWSDNSAGNSYIDNRYDSTAASVIFRMQTAGTSVNVMTLTAGNVGIGTASPLARLHSSIDSSAVTATSYDGYFENLATNTTTDGINKYGLYVTSTGSFTGSSGTATNNYGLYVNTPTGADNNYAAIFAGGNVGIGTTSPASLLHVVGASGQLRLGYDASNYASLSVASDGGTTLATTGTDPDLALELGNGNLTVNSGGLFYSPTNHRFALNNSSSDGLFEVAASSGTQTDAVPTMTSATTPSGIVTASSGSNPYYAFNDNNSTYWSTSATQWIAYEFVSPKTITKYTITGSSQSTYRSPSEWTLEGWDGSQWVVLDTQSGHNYTTWTLSGKKTFTISNSTAYLKYRFNNITSGSTLEIIEMELMEDVSYDVPALYVGTSGNVGIGDSTPDHLLDVAGNIGLSASSYLNWGDTDGETGYGFRDNAGTMEYKNSSGSWASFSSGGGGMSIGGSITSATQGSILFAGASGALTQDNTNFFWDDANNRLGLGTATPNQQLELTGSLRLPATTSATTGVIYKDANRFIHDFAATGTSGANTFIGVNAGNLTLTGSDSGSEGSYNVAIGNSALTSLTTGAYNVALGREALRDNQSGYNNVAIGYASLVSSTASDNLAIGYHALSSNTTGSGNAGIGIEALRYNATGGSNTAIGYRAGRGVSGSSFYWNTMIGYGAGQNVRSNRHVMIGYNAGSNVSTGGNNILMGYQAGDNVTTGESNILIGYDIDAQSATGHGQLSIGNLIFGTGGFGTGTSVGAGNVGIGTASPSEKLTVYNGSTTGTYTTSGWAHSSDARLKTNIESITGALDTLSLLDGVSFHWVNDPEGDRQIGFIAQDVMGVLPEVVTGSDEDADLRDGPAHRSRRVWERGPARGEALGRDRRDRRTRDRSDRSGRPDDRYRRHPAGRDRPGRRRTRRPYRTADG